MVPTPWCPSAAPHGPTVDSVNGRSALAAGKTHGRDRDHEESEHEALQHARPAGSRQRAPQRGIHSVRPPSGWRAGRREAPRRVAGLHELGEHDEALGGAVLGVARGHRHPAPRWAARRARRAPPRSPRRRSGRTISPRGDLVDDHCLLGLDHDPVTVDAAGRCRGTAGRRSCGARRGRSCRPPRARRCRRSGPRRARARRGRCPR